MFKRRTPSIFKSEDRRELALERLATGIVAASDNCLMVIANIIAICQKPKKYSEQHMLIKQWSEELFLYKVLPVDGNRIEDELPNEKIEQLSNLFFDYIISLMPFFYYEKSIDATKAILNRGKYKWTSADYAELQKKILYKRYASQLDKLDVVTRFAKIDEIQLKVDKAYRTMQASSSAASSFRNKQKKIDALVSTKTLESKMAYIKPDFKYQYQFDLYESYHQEFVRLISSSLSIFDDNFYEVGTYLHKFFQWSGD